MLVELAQKDAAEPPGLERGSVAHAVENVVVRVGFLPGYFCHDIHSVSTVASMYNCIVYHGMYSNDGKSCLCHTAGT